MAWKLPGAVEVENFDVGGQNVSYHDADERNRTRYCRNDWGYVKKADQASNGAIVA